MVNLCKDDHCVRLALDIDGWVREHDGQIARSPKPPLFLPSLLVANGVAVPEGWVPHPSLDGWMPPGDAAERER
jgi:hypothetical protein